LASSCYGFISVLPTKDLLCIERIAVSNETAHALRNKIKNSSAKIRGTEEKKMRIMTILKNSMITVALGFACLLPATARAQSDMSPDEYAFSATETTAAQPVHAASAKLTKADFQGKVSLPYDVKCGGQEFEGGTLLALREV
jgi:hypothetical protein